MLKMFFQFWKRSFVIKNKFNNQKYLGEKKHKGYSVVAIGAFSYYLIIDKLVSYEQNKLIRSQNRKMNEGNF